MLAESSLARVVRTEEGAQLTFPETVRAGEVEIPFFQIPHERADILAFPNVDALNIAVAAHLHEFFGEYPHGFGVFPSGETWKDIYAAAARMISHPARSPFRDITGFQVDERLGVGPEHPHSYASYHRERVAMPLGISFRYFNGLTQDPVWEARRIQMLESQYGPFRLTGLGMDPDDGHIGFIRPGTPFSQKDIHVTKLTDATIARDVRRGEPRITHAITHGYGMLNAQQVMLVLSGREKGKKLREAIIAAGPRDEIPVSHIVDAAYRPRIYVDSKAAWELIRPDNFEAFTSHWPPAPTA